MIDQATIISNHPNPTDTVVMFIDYECPFCRSAEPALQRAVAGGLAIALLHLPLERIHPRAREAASAAVCAEELGMFADIHHALMDKDEWMEGGRWEEFADENGVSDTKAFVACMESEPTSSRVAANVALAALLGVKGTPTFITDTGIEAGGEGLRSVLSRVGTAPLQERYTLQDIVFVSVDFPHEGVSMIGRLSGGLMLDLHRIVLADGMALSLFIVDTSSGEVTTVGRRGEGPGDFQRIRAIGRADPGGFFVDDFVNARVTLFADDGSLIDAVTYNPLSFRGHAMIPRPIGVHADGAVVFRDADPMFSERADGPYRGKISYLALMPDGSQVGIAEADGREVVRRNYGTTAFNTYEKPFSYSALAAVAGDLVLVADTESGNVSAYNRSGDAVMTFSFGPGVPVSREADRLWREEKIVRREERDGIPADVPAGVSQLLGGLRGMGRDEEEFYKSAEGNTVAPALARMLVDGDGWAWVQRYTLPGADTAVWQRWHLGENRLDGILELPTDYRLLDARGDRVLLRATDELGVPKAILATLKATR